MEIFGFFFILGVVGVMVYLAYAVYVISLLVAVQKAINDDKRTTKEINEVYDIVCNREKKGLTLKEVKKLRANKTIRKSIKRTKRECKRDRM